MYCYVLKLLFLTPQSYSPNLAAKSLNRDRLKDFCPWQKFKIKLFHSMALKVSAQNYAGNSTLQKLELVSQFKSGLFS